MLLNLHKLSIRLQTDNRLIRRSWQHLFGSWLAEEAAGGANAPHQIELTLALSDKLPALPPGKPYFEDARPLPDDIGILSVYQGAGNRRILHYLDGAVVTLSLSDAGGASDPARISGSLTPAVLAYGRFEDVNYTSMAPALRRQGYYLMHAFAAVKEGRAVIISGESGSGKTTTGLALILDGWQLLSNDILLLEARADGIYALPTPGTIGIRPHTLTLLPALKALLGDTPPRQGITDLSSDQIFGGTIPAAARVSDIYFPEITTAEAAVVRPAKRAYGLARLMEESMDRWDEPMLGAHISFLETLCQQANIHRLFLGREVSQLSQLL